MFLVGVFRSSSSGSFAHAELLLFLAMRSLVVHTNVLRWMTKYTVNLP